MRSMGAIGAMKNDDFLGEDRRFRCLAALLFTPKNMREEREELDAI
jgi:hypothetical protein